MSYKEMKNHSNAYISLSTSRLAYLTRQYKYVYYVKDRWFNGLRSRGGGYISIIALINYRKSNLIFCLTVCVRMNEI